MISFFKNTALVAVLLFLLTSCSNEDDKPDTSRVIKYELSGTYDGQMEVTYTDGDGKDVRLPKDLNGTAALPWTKEITVNTEVKAVSLRVKGIDGIKQNVNLTLKIYHDENHILTKSSSSDGGALDLFSGYYELP